MTGSFNSICVCKLITECITNIYIHLYISNLMLFGKFMRTHTHMCRFTQDRQDKIKLKRIF